MYMKCFIVHKLYLNKTNILFKRTPRRKRNHFILLATSQMFSSANFYLSINSKPPDKNLTFCNTIYIVPINLNRKNLICLFYLLSLQTKAGGNVTSNLV